MSSELLTFERYKNGPLPIGSSRVGDTAYNRLHFAQLRLVRKGTSTPSIYISVGHIGGMMMDIEKDTAEVRDELSVFQLMQAFPNNLAAEQWLERLRWPDKEDRNCPSCGSNDIIEVASRKPTPFRCVLVVFVFP